MLRAWPEKPKMTFGKLTAEIYGQIQQRKRNYLGSSFLASEKFELARLFDKEQLLDQSYPSWKDQEWFDENFR